MQALSHCQVPCGIFQDQARVQGMMEDAATIRKAMVQTGELSTKVASGDAQSLNQSCRWISTKDEHANRIISTTAEYFLAQRVVVRTPSLLPAGFEQFHTFPRCLSLCRTSPQEAPNTMRIWSNLRSTMP